MPHDFKEYTLVVQEYKRSKPLFLAD